MRYAVACALLLFILVAGCVNTPAERTEDISFGAPDPAKVEQAERIMGQLESQQPERMYGAVTEEDTGDEQGPISDDIKVVNIKVRQFEYEPSLIEVEYGDDVLLTVTSMDVGHGFALPDFGLNGKVPPEESVTFRFVADQRGEFAYFNPVYSGEGWKDMKGTLVVR